MNATAKPSPSPAPRWSVAIWVVGGALIAAISAFYLWMAQSSANPYEFKAESRGYYNLLTDGFLDGHLWMKATPPPEILNAANPHDPKLAPLGLHDASYYKGHYYLYFGATPVVVLFLPFKALTGLHCPENLAVALFCIAGFLVNATLAALLLRRCFPMLRAGWWLVAIVGLGLGNVATLLLRRAAFWDVPIASGYLFGSAALLGALLALTGRHPVRWLVLTGTCYGLAIGSRPVFVYGALALLVLWWAVSDRSGWRVRWTPRSVGRGFALFLPATVLLGVILWYNHARFETSFEFGMKWALTGYDMVAWKMFDWANLPLNAWYYFLSPAHWSGYFPFVQMIGPAPIATPPNYYGQDNVYGIVPNLPIVIFALMLPVCWRRAREFGSASQAFVFLALGVFAANSLVLLAFSASAGRYMVDMAPYAVLLGFCGVWAGAAVWPAGWSTRLWTAVALVAVLKTATFNVFAGYHAGRVFELQNPDGYARTARVFNRLPAWLEEMRGYAPGPLQLKVRFPKGKVSRYEPLVTTGWYYLGDLLYTKYGADGLIEFGFTHMNSPALAGPQVKIDYDAEHTLEIEMGSLYPPAIHPWFEGVLPQQLAQYKRRLRLRLDGQEVLSAETAFYESGPGDVLVGRNPLGFIVEKEFTGQLLAVKRLTATPPSRPQATSGPLRFVVRLPADKIGQAEPLVTTGRTGSGDVVLIRYEAPNRVRFAHDHWGQSLAESEPVEIDPTRTHEIEIWMGSLMTGPLATARPWGEPGAGGESWCAVRLDGRIVWAVPRPQYAAKTDEVYPLQNPIGSSSCQPMFSGQIESWARGTGSR